MRFSSRHRRLLLSGALLLLAGFPAGGEAQVPPTEDNTFQVGYSSSLFSEVDAGDARAATQIWIKSLVRKVEDLVDAQTYVFQNTDEVVKILKARRLDLAVLPPDEFLQITEQVPELTPVWVGASANGRIGYRFTLLVHRESGISGPAQLIGKKVVLERKGVNALPRMWLETVLLKGGFSGRGAGLGEVREARKAAQAVLSVFFRQADACVVPDETLETMTELNPQLGRDLVVLDRSPEVCRALVCLRANIVTRYRVQIQEALRDLHTDAHGRQILNVFRVERLVPFEPAQVEGVRALISENATQRRGVR